jgi:protein-tyrosine phosphatase
MEHDAVHVLATDAHDVKNRPPVLSEGRDAVSKRFGDDFARVLVLDNPAAIIAGQPLPSSRRAANERMKSAVRDSCAS